ncbi:hypothetical protein EK21DRAFT_106209 [Setomelanomma holmii]|uniref:Uncharacterized protein n=1 Tax=Setomelanomma holmii TaxID=210430 RepID=A0A9P4HKM3_9PLEO|nr:hypothetical protein EK21DRAFT_106209 [Setomelanomma holmii]
MSCTAAPVPAPPTSLTSCAVPVGGSNSTILDVCCNSHVNSFATYAAPGASNVRSDDGCFQFCTTDNPEYVSGCLTNTLGEYASAINFECFNVPNVKKDSGSGAGGDESGYGNAAGRIGGGRIGWAMGVVVGLSLVGAVLETA